MSLPLDIFGWCASLSEAIGADDQTLPLSATEAAELCATLGDDTVTFALRSGGRVEAVDVSCAFGALVMKRGVDGSTPMAHAVGTIVRFDSCLPSNLVRAFECVKGTLLCGLESDTLSITPDDDEPCKLHIELKPEDGEDPDDADETVSWQTLCGQKLTASAKVVKSTNLPAQFQLTPGVYDPARVVVGDNCELAISKSNAAVNKSCGGGCGCASCAESEAEG